MEKMREISFRGRRLDNGAWVEGGYHKQTLRDGTQREKHFIIVSSERPGYPFEYFEVDPGTVCQRTEAKDSNGNWIFEGDIVNSIYEPKGEPAFEDLAVVSWTGGGFFNMYKNAAGEWTDYDWVVDETYLESEASKRIVIGNIHENKDLLR